MAQHDLAGADGVGRDTRISLETDARISSGAPGAGAAHDFVTDTERVRRTSCTGQVLRPLRDGADCRLKIKLDCVDFKLFGNRHGTESRGRMPGLSKPRLTALRERRHAAAVLGRTGIRNWNCPQQIPYKVVEFGIGNEVRRPLIADRSTDPPKTRGSPISAWLPQAKQ